MYGSVAVGLGLLRNAPPLEFRCTTSRSQQRRPLPPPRHSRPRPQSLQTQVTRDAACIRSGAHVWIARRVAVAGDTAAAPAPAKAKAKVPAKAKAKVPAKAKAKARKAAAVSPAATATAAHPSQWAVWECLLRVMTLVAGDFVFALSEYKYGGLCGYAVPRGIADPAAQFPRMAQEIASAVATASCSGGDGVVMARPGATRNAAADAEALLRRAHGDTWMPAVRFLGWILRKLWRHLFRQGVDAGQSFVDAVQAAVLAAQAEPGVAVVLVPTHKSHLDYLILSYLCFSNNLPMPRVASGDNLLELPVIGPMLFRHTGALFIRRSNRTRQDADLYKAVLDESMAALCTSGCVVEFFIEGGRSRDGCIGEPRFGLLGSIAGLVRDGTLHDALLVPVGINYDRVPEDTSYAAQLSGGEKRPESLGGLLGAVRRLSGRNMGAAYVRAGRPISMAAVLAEAGPSSARAPRARTCKPERTGTQLAAVGRAVMRSLDAASAVTPTAFVAAALLACPAPRCSRGWLARRVQWLMSRVGELGAHVAGCDTALSAVVRAMGVLELPSMAPDGDIAVPQDALTRLRLLYYSNQLLCVLGPECVVATAFCSLRKEARGGCIPFCRVLERCAFVADVATRDFPRCSDRGREAAALDRMVARGTLRVSDACAGSEPLVSLGTEGDRGLEAGPRLVSFPSPAPQQELDFLTRQARRVFGGYWAVAAAASRAAAGAATEEIVARARKIIRNAGNGRVLPGSPLSALSKAELRTITPQTLHRASRWLSHKTGSMEDLEDASSQICARTAETVGRKLGCCCCC